MNLKLILLLTAGLLIFVVFIWKLFLFVMWELEEKVFYRGVVNFFEKDKNKEDLSKRRKRK